MSTQPMMTVYTLGQYRRMQPSNVLPLRKKQPTPQEVRVWQMGNKVRA